MKVRSIKGIALSMVLATMSASSLEAFHHHSDHCCTIPFPDADVYIDPAVIAWHTIAGDLNTIFAAGSYSGNFQSTALSDLITAEKGTGAGSLGQAIASFQNVLLNLNADATLVANIGTQIAAVDTAAINYASSVYTLAPSQQATLYNTWLSQGQVLAQLLSQLSANQSLSVINQFISDMISAQGQVILGYVGVISGVSSGLNQAQVAVAMNQVAHVKATDIAGYVVGQLVISANCNACR